MPSVSALTARLSAQPLRRSVSLSSSERRELSVKKRFAGVPSVKLREQKPKKLKMLKNLLRPTMKWGNIINRFIR